MVNSRLAGFYQLTVPERIRLLAETLGVPETEISEPLASGGLATELADKIVENVLGTYALPFAVALNFQINQRDRLIPMVVEEPSVIAAASNAAKMIRGSGGFVAAMNESLMIAQIELRQVPDVNAARGAINANHDELLALASDALPGLIRRGGGPRGIETRQLGSDHLVVHLLVDCCDAMGANLINGAAEFISARLAQLSGGTPGLRILSNLTDRRRVQITARASGIDLARGLEMPPEEVLDQIEAASIFAERDPYRAATHNKGIMNGVDSVVIATGNDYRAVEAGAHAFAAISGTYKPLATWRRVGDFIEGKLDMPLALGTVGGTLRVHPTARLGLALGEIESASDLALLAGSAGLASNLAALRALATEGIQRGHMALHARSVAIAAGASGADVETVAQALSQSGNISLANAQQILTGLSRQ